MFRFYIQSVKGFSFNLWVLFTATLINRSGTMVLPFLALYIHLKLGISELGAGLAISMYGAGMLIAFLAGGMLADRFGSRKTMIISFIGSGLCLFVLSLLHSYLLIMLGVLITSLFNGAFRPPSGAAISFMVDEADQPRAFALIRWANNMGMTIGPALGGVLVMVSYKLLFYIDGATALLAGLVLFLFYEEVTLGKNNIASSKDSLRILKAISPWRNKPFMVFCFLMMGLGLIVFQHISALPIYMKVHCGQPESFFGAIVALNTGMIILFELPLVRIIQRFNRTKIMGIGFLLFGIGFGMYGLGHAKINFVLATIVWTVGEIMLLPLAITHVASIASPSMQGRYMGVYMASYGISFVIAPALGTYVLESLGPHILWGTCFLLGSVLSVLKFLYHPD